jgi:carboxypeptidase family protein/TonB-dependent receptor-like protein
MDSRTTRGLAAGAALSLSLCAGAALAQTATSTLTGVVVDESGAAVPGATVTARNTDTGAASHAVTNKAGRYSIASLDPGPYEVKVEMAGFKTVVRGGIGLRVAGSSSVDFTLGLGQVAEQVVVSETEPLIETTKADMSRVVGTTEIQSIPNIGRNFVDFVKLSSAVAIGRENVGGGPFKEADVAVGAAAAPRLSFGGQQELNTLVQVDGVDNVQTFTGLPRATPSQEAVREFRILHSTYAAEYGRALGGFVNIVTKSGTNEPHGSVYYYGMDDALASPSILNAPGQDKLSQHQYGAFFGGPLQKDRTFFFASYEGQKRDEANQFSRVIRDNLAAINAVRVKYGLSAETVDQVRTNDYDTFMAKLDHRASDKLRLTARYNFLNSEALNFPGGAGRASAASSAARNNHTRDHSAVVGATATFNPRLLAEARVQWAQRSYHFEPIVGEPTMEITNLILMGKTTSDPDFYKENRWQGTASLLYTRGGHQAKFGFDFSQIHDDATWNLFFPARIIFPTLPAFLSLTPAVFWFPVLADSPIYPGVSTTWTDPVPEAWHDDTQFSRDHSIMGLFAQDEWTVNRKLTLTYGLRYDLEKYPSFFLQERDTNNVQPRLGIAYAFSPKSVLRGGAGIFTDRLASSVGQVLTAAEWSSRGDAPTASILFPGVSPIRGRFRQTTVGGPAATAAAVTFLTTGRAPLTGATSLTDNMNGSLQNPYSIQASLQYSRELGAGLALSVSYLFVRANDLLGHTGNLNAFQTGTQVTGEPIVAGRTYPELGNFHVTDNIGHSEHHGGTVELRRPLAHGIGFTASYTLAHTTANVESITNLGDFPEFTDLSKEESLSRQHVAHRGTLAFMSEVPRSVSVVGGFKFSALLSANSGRFFTVYVGADANGDGNPNADRTGTLGKNSLEGPGYVSLDGRISREFSLGGKATGEISVDVFNVFNRANVKDLNTVWGSADPSVPPIPSFNTPREVFNPRQAQIGLRLRF